MKRYLPIILLSVIFFNSAKVLKAQQFFETDFVEGELIVQIHERINIDEELANLNPEFGFKAERELSAIMRAWLVSFDTQKISHNQAIGLLSSQKAFSIVQNNHLVTLRSTIPNDPEFNVQWHHQNTGQSSGTVDADIDSDEAWDITTGGTTAAGDNIVACIIEGVDMTHTDLINNRWQNPNEIAGNGIDDDNNGYIDDIYGWNVTSNNGNIATGAHGTNVAGMIGARGNNSTGVVGANWNVKIMVVSGYNVNSEANIISCYNYPLVQRKLYTQTNGARGAFVVVTNASWGIDNGNPNTVPLWCQFYDTLGAYGILNCAATTNSNLNVDVSGDIPTACSSPYMIGVGRTDRNDNFAGGYGLTTIDLAAPGINVRTTSGTNAYTTTTGTSFASPLTAGVIALLYAIPCTNYISIAHTYPKLGADLVRDALLQGVDQKPSLANYFITGGRLNAKNAMDILMNNSCNGAFCLAPASSTHNNLSTTVTEISWVAAAGATSYNFYHRPAGSGSWLSQSVGTTNITLSGLNECASYEYYIETDCDGSVSDASAIFTFTTGCGNCTDLPYCTARSLESSQSLLSVLLPSNIAANYTYQAPSAWGGSLNNTYVAGNIVLVDDGTASDSLGCGTLVNSSVIAGNIALVYRGTCQFGTKALNAQNAGAAAVIIVNNAGGTTTIDMAVGNDGASVTIPVVMISQNNGAILKNSINTGNTISAILGTKNEWIQTLEVNGIVNNSGNDNGYGNYLASSPLYLAQTLSYPVNIIPGFSNNPYNVYNRIWIDFNQNGNFESGELVFDSGIASSSTVSGTITIPQDALIGSTRMRVVMSYEGPGQTTLPDVCASFDWGEVEDYCVEITNITGVTATASGNYITVFPNPATDILHFIIHHPQVNTIGLFTITGERIMEQQITGNYMDVDISELSAGLYFYKATAFTGENLKGGLIAVR